MKKLDFRNWQSLEGMDGSILQWKRKIRSTKMSKHRASISSQQMKMKNEKVFKKTGS